VRGIQAPVEVGAFMGNKLVYPGDEECCGCILQ
jgi:hypothetical protein